MFYRIMSAEKIINTKNENFSNLVNLATDQKKPSGRVDINHLLTKVREKQDKENKKKIIFFGVFIAIVLATGILLSF